MNKSLLLCTLSLASIIMALPSTAQVIADPSLNSIVTNDNASSSRISGGKQVGTNLFHSLRDFSLSAGDRAIFVNSDSSLNIFTRVTGSRISNLNGQISTTNPSNLYIFNSNGIFFGNSIQLNIAGSFLASTATSIEFNDGFEFNTRIADTPQLLSSQPLSLIRFAGDSGSIILNGPGNNLNVDPITQIGIGPGLSDSGIRVPFKQNVVLIGDGIFSNGGIVTAPSGSISLGSVKAGDVSFQGFQATQDSGKLNFNAVTEFSDINFTNSALVDTSGNSDGYISLSGKNLTLDESSYIVIQNVDGPGGGLISLDFQENILFAGRNNRPILPAPLTPLTNSSGIISSSVFSKGADIKVVARNLTLADAGVILNNSALGGLGGSTSIDVSESILIQGDVLPLPNLAFSTIFVSGTFGGQPGSLDVSAKNITLRNHGTIQGFNRATQDAGDLTVNVEENLILEGLSPISGQENSIITTSSNSGAAGDLILRAKNISLFDGSIIGSAALSSGNSGDVEVFASESIFISGFRFNTDGGIQQSAIGTIANQNDSLEQFLFTLPEFPSGNVGNTTIKTGTLTINNGGLISASNEGFGGTGDLSIEADSIDLDQSNILSFAFSSNGGNINIASDSIFLRNKSSISVNSLGAGNGGLTDVNSNLGILNTSSSIPANSADTRGGNIELNTKLLQVINSEISATTLGNGSGGNITINSEIAALLGNSNINANAQNAQGGNININALGFFLSPESAITATSQLGPQFDGSVIVEAEITDFSRDPNLNIQSEPPELYASCGPSYRDTLAYYRVGTGGQPVNPDTLTDLSSQWLKVAKARYDQRQLTYADPKTGEHKPLKRVVGWKTNENGTVSFVNDPREADQFTPKIASNRQACKSNQTAKS